MPRLNCPSYPSSTSHRSHASTVGGDVGKLHAPKRDNFLPSMACSCANALSKALAMMASALSRTVRRVFGSIGGLTQQHVQRRQVGVPFNEAGQPAKPLQSVPINASHIWPQGVAVVIDADGDGDVVRMGIVGQLNFIDNVLRQGIKEAGHVPTSSTQANSPHRPTGFRQGRCGSSGRARERHWHTGCRERLL